MKTVVVTGATGFIGRHFVRHLAALGTSVRCLGRNSARTMSSGGNITWMRCNDITDSGVLSAAMDGADTVIHLAAHVHVMRSGSLQLEEFARVNVEGTRTVVEAARGAGADRLLFMSSVAVFGPGDDRHIDSRAVPTPRTPYAASKLAAERIVADCARSSGMRAVILRPPAVYGPFMKGNIPRLFRLVRGRVPIPVPAMPKRRSLIYVENLVHAGIRALLDVESGTSTYLVADSELVSTRELIHIIGDKLHVRPLIVPVPAALMTALGRIGDRVDSRIAFPVNSHAVHGLFSELTLDISSIMQETRYRPAYTLDDAMSLTAQWFTDSRAGSPATSQWQSRS